jgi:glycosyltransferase involved in cell wall biosynthesis
MSTTRTNYRKQTRFGSKIKFSIIIPSFRSEKTIEKCLQSLSNQNYSKQRYEIIVVDNFSKDNTEKIAKKFKKIRFIKKVSNPAEARNYGAKVSKGVILIFTDADCVVPKNLLKKVEEDFEKNDIAGVGGGYKTLNKENEAARFVGYEIAWRHSKEPKYTNFLGTYCCAYKRDVFLKFNGFNEKFLKASGEDPEFSFRLAKAGYKLLFNKKLFVWHVHPSSFGKYFKQQFWRAYWRALMYKKHPEKVFNESYTGFEIPIASFFMSLFLLSLLLSIFYFEFLYMAFFSLIAFFATYTGFFKFIHKKEPGMLFKAAIVIFSRTIICFLGFGRGFIDILRGK